MHSGLFPGYIYPNCDSFPKIILIHNADVALAPVFDTWFMKTRGSMVFIFLMIYGHYIFSHKSIGNSEDFNRLKEVLC